jgi:CRP-like cAMP-binding protein
MTHDLINYDLDSLLTEDHPELRDLRHITENFEKSFYKKGEILLRERNPAWGVYFVYAGKLKLYKLGSDGKEQIIRIASDGDFIGYTSVLNHSKYNVSATVLEDSTLAFIPKSDFVHIFAANPSFAEHFLHLLCLAVQAAEKRITDMAYRPVRGRLAEALLALDMIYQQEDDEKEDFINLSRQDLANLLGIAKETVIRLLSEFRYDKLITTDGYRISILDPNKLKSISLM